MNAIALVLSLASLVAAPTIAGRLLGLKGGLGKGAIVGLVTVGLQLIIQLVAGFLGPLGPVLAIMLTVAAWYQVVKVVHGTDPARTLVFIFWHFFFQVLASSLIALLFDGSNAFFWLPW